VRAVRGSAQPIIDGHRKLLRCPELLRMRWRWLASAGKDLAGRVRRYQQQYE
jgi:hypothetical protein